MAVSNLPEQAGGNPIKMFQDALVRASGSMSAVAAKHMRPERMIKVAVGAAMRNPLLLKCTTASVVRSVIQAAELGLEPGSALGEAHLVPFKNNKKKDALGNWGVYECIMIPGYKGLVSLARRSGEVSTVSAEVVYREDRFEHEFGTTPRLVHVPNYDIELPDMFWPDEKDNSIDCRWNHVKLLYSVGLLKDGGRQIAIMPRNAVERIRQRSMAKDKGPWVTDWEEMGKKTVLKRNCKLLPMSVELARAIEFDNAIESGDFAGLEFDAPEAVMENVEEAGNGGNGGNGGGGMAAAKASLKDKAETKSADELAKALKKFKLNDEHRSEVVVKLAAINGAPGFDEFIVQASRDGLGGFAELLKRLAEMKEADQGKPQEELL